MADWDSFSRMARGETREYNSEKRYLRKDGKVVWVQIAATAVHDPVASLSGRLALFKTSPSASWRGKHCIRARHNSAPFFRTPTQEFFF